MTPCVSLAMPVYNGEKFIDLALRSILNQTYTDFELIITDNNSNDATGKICRRFEEADPRVRYYRNSKNMGAASNYNRGYELARGKYLKWCAHDDLISEKLLERCVEALDARPDACLAFARTQCIDELGNSIPWDERNIMEAIEDQDPSKRFYKAIIHAGTCFPIFGLFRMEMLRKSTLHRGYYGSDRALIAEALLLGTAVQVANDAVFFNREHSRRSINISDHAARSQWQDASAGRLASMEHVNLLMHLIEIANRHPSVVPRRKTLAKIVKLGLTRRQLGRYALDILRLVTPLGAARLRKRVNRSVEQTF